MKKKEIKERLQACRRQREALALKVLWQRAEIDRLKKEVEALEQESFNMFCKYREQADKNTELKRQQLKVGDDIEIEFEPLPMRQWWQAIWP